MEAKTVYVNDDNSVTLCCPSCGIIKNISLDKYKTLKQQFSVRCKCDNIFKVHIDFRRAYRKMVALPGEYRILSPRASTWMNMSVCDISRNGVCIILTEPADLKKGDTLYLKFKLDNTKQTLVDKKVEVRSVGNGKIGCKFIELELYERELGFYLMP